MHALVCEKSTDMEHRKSAYLHAAITAAIGPPVTSQPSDTRTRECLKGLATVWDGK